MKGRVLGCRSTSDRLMIEKLDWSGVNWKSWLSVTFSSSTAFLSSMTSRWPTRAFVSSVRSEIVSMRPFFRDSTIESMIDARVTWNGISVKTMYFLPTLLLDVVTCARTTT